MAYFQIRTTGEKLEESRKMQVNGKYQFVVWREVTEGVRTRNNRTMDDVIKSNEETKSKRKKKS